MGKQAGAANAKTGWRSFMHACHCSPASRCMCPIISEGSQILETHRIQWQSNVVPDPPSTESKGSECSFRGRHSARWSNEQHWFIDLSGSMKNQGWKVSVKDYLIITQGHTIHHKVLLLCRHRSACLAWQPNSKAISRSNISQRFAAIACRGSSLMRRTRLDGTLAMVISCIKSCSDSVLMPSGRVKQQSHKAFSHEGRPRRVGGL